MFEIVALIGLVAYNNLLNLWPPFNGWAFVPLNLSAALALSGAAVAATGGSLRNIAGENAWSDVVLGVVLGIAVTAPLFALAASRWKALVADRRVAHLAGRRLAFRTLIRIPIGTALLEEIAFRGVLLALLADAGAIGAALISSATFGLWHISPTLNALQANVPNISTTRTLRAILGAVGVTFAAGMLLCWLRFASGGIALPLAVHASVNSASTIAAVRAHRSTERRSLSPRP